MNPEAQMVVGGILAAGAFILMAAIVAFAFYDRRAR